MDKLARSVTVGPRGAVCITLTVAGLAALLVFLASVTNSARQAQAHNDPLGCNPLHNPATILFDADPLPDPIIDGGELRYALGLTHPAPPTGISCTLFNIDLFLDVPPIDGNYQLVCHIPELLQGQTAGCADPVIYVIDLNDRDGDDLLQARVRAIGDKHDRVNDCTVPEPRDPSAGAICFGASANHLIALHDSDEDGCTDAHEHGKLPARGGDRDPKDPWDFFDVTGDASIDLADVLAILKHYGHGAGNDPNDDRLDRSAPDPQKPWRTAPASDGIDLQDVLANLASYGHSCA